MGFAITSIKLNGLSTVVAILILDLVLISKPAQVEGSSFADSATQGLLGMLFAPFDNGDNPGQQKKGPNLSELLGVQPQGSATAAQKPTYQVNPGPQPNYGSLPNEQENPTRSGYPVNPWYNQPSYKQHWVPPPKHWAPPPEKPWTPAPTWTPPPTWAPPPANASGSHGSASWPQVHYEPKPYYPHYHYHHPKPKPNLNGYIHTSWKPPPPAHGPWKKPSYGLVDTHVRLPPIKFRFHLSPKITLASNTKDPLDKQKPGYQDEDFVYPPPTPYPPHQAPPASPHQYDIAHHHKGLYDPTFRVKVNPTVIEPKLHYSHYPHHQHHYGYAQPHYTPQHVHYQPWQPWQSQGTDRQGSANATRRSENSAQSGSGSVPVTVAAPSVSYPVTTRPFPRSISFDSTPVTTTRTTTTTRAAETTTRAPTTQISTSSVTVTTVPSTNSVTVTTVPSTSSTMNSVTVTTVPSTSSTMSSVSSTNTSTQTNTIMTTTLSTNAQSPTSTMMTTVSSTSTRSSFDREPTTSPTPSPIANVSENEITREKKSPEVPATTPNQEVTTASTSVSSNMNTTTAP